MDDQVDATVEDRGLCCGERASAAVLEKGARAEVALATLAKALGRPTRVGILRLLSERSSCVTGDLVARLPLAQSTVSGHLRILREARDLAD